MTTVVHFDEGESFFAPASGRHTVCACGEFMQDSYAPNKKRKTRNKKRVTCKRCLAYIARQQAKKAEGPKKSTSKRKRPVKA